jgi:hypothetical protein
MGVSWNGVPKWIVNGQSYWNGWFGGSPFFRKPPFSLTMDPQWWISMDIIHINPYNPH